MGKRLLTVTAEEVFEQHLEIIEEALDAGDVCAARQVVLAVRRTLLDQPADGSGPAAALPGGVALTGKETATLRLLPDGSLSQKDIARAMGVTRNTLKTHLKSLYLKLGVHCRSEAIHRAREVGLLSRSLSVVAEPERALVDVA